jgi:gluconokinase
VTPPGAATIAAEALRGHVEAVIGEALTAAHGEIAAVGMDTFVGNILGVDRAGNALTPIYTYADTRSADDVLLLRDRIDMREMHRRTGTMHHTAYLPARLHWLRRTQPDVFAAVDQWIDFGTYLYRRWFGTPTIPMSYSVASWSGMLNRETLDWDDRWLNVLDLPKDALPPLGDYTDFAQNPVKGVKRLMGVPFFLSVGDGAAANIGTGCDDPTKIALTLGTTAALRVVNSSTLPSVPYGLWGYRVNRVMHLIGGATSEGGSIFQWARETLQLSPAEIESLSQRQPDQHGLTFLPLLAGERSPGWEADATGAVTGLRLSTTPLDLLQAAMEGVALRLAMIADQLDAPEASVIGSGGALSTAWAQMIADALNRPVSVLAAESAITAWGTAVLVFQALGVTPLAATPPIGAVYTPQPAHVALLTQAKARQTDLYRMLYKPL